MNQNYIQMIDATTALLTAAGVAAPVVFGLVMGLVGLVKGVTGLGPTPLESADRIEAKLASNDTEIKAEIARLKALLPNEA